MKIMLETKIEGAEILWAKFGRFIQRSKFICNTLLQDYVRWFSQPQLAVGERDNLDTCEYNKTIRTKNHYTCYSCNTIVNLPLLLFHKLKNDHERLNFCWNEGKAKNMWSNENKQKVILSSRCFYQEEKLKEVFDPSPIEQCYTTTD